MIIQFVIEAELADPHGTDEHDLPLHKICAEIKACTCQTYRDSEDEILAIMRDTGYSHDRPEPDPAIKEEVSSKRHIKLMRLSKSRCGMSFHCSQWLSSDPCLL